MAYLCWVVVRLHSTPRRRIIFLFEVREDRSRILIRSDRLKCLITLILFFFLLANLSASSSNLIFLPLEERGVEVQIEGLNPQFIAFFLVHPQGMRELLSSKEIFTIPMETGGDYRLYGEYIDEDVSYRAKFILSTSGRERTYSEGVGGSLLEILPQLPPEEMKKDRTFVGKVVRYGVAKEGALLEVLKPNKEISYFESDEMGIFRAPLNRPGVYVVTGSIREGLLHQTSYTFVVEDDTRERAIQSYFYLFFLLLLFFYIVFKYFKRVIG